MSKLLLSGTPLNPNGGSTDEYETDDYSASDVSSGEKTSRKLSNGGTSQPPRTTRKNSTALNDDNAARSIRGGESPARHASNSDSDSDCTIPIVGKDLNNDGKKNTVASLPKTAATAKNNREAASTKTTTTTTTNVGTRKSGRKTTATIKAAAASTIATKKMPTTTKSQSNVKTTSTNDRTDDDYDDDESDSDDDPFADLSRFNESTKRRKVALSSEEEEDDDDDDSDGSDVSSDEYTSKKSKTKVPINKSKKPIVKSSAKGKSAYSSSDDNSSIEFPEQTPHPARAAARSPSKKISTTEAIQLLSDDDDDDDVICRTFRSPPKRPASNVSATRNGKQETDPSVRAESNAALEIGRLAREKLKAAQNYKAKELDPIPPPSSTTIQRESVVQRPVVVVRPSSAVIPPVQTTVSYTGPTIQLKLQYTHPVTNKNSKMSVKIKMDQQLQHLVDEFQSKQPTLKITSMKFDGDKLNMTKTPSFFDMDDDDMVDAIVVKA